MDIGGKLCGNDPAFALVPHDALHDALLYRRLADCASRRQDIGGVAHEQRGSLFACMHSDPN